MLEGLTLRLKHVVDFGKQLYKLLTPNPYLIQIVTMMRFDARKFAMEKE